MLRTSVSAAILAGTLAAAACGGEDPGRNAERYEGAKRDVAQVVDDLEAASRSDDATKICKEILSEELARRIETQTQTTCEDRLKRQIVSKERRFDVKSLRVEGDDRARARVQDQAGNASILELRKRDDAWRIAEIEAVSS